jgi:hypothetical protein
MIQKKLEYERTMQVVDPLQEDAFLKLQSLRGKYVLFVVFNGAYHTVSTAELTRNQFCRNGTMRLHCIKNLIHL